MQEKRTKHTAAPSESWIQAVDADELEPGAMKVVRSKDGAAKRQILVGRTEDGEVFAVDNRCPHEGYPLVQGTLKGDALTCCWHNWKFDVRDGSCTLGGEGVRPYPCRVSGGVVEVDVTEPDPADSFDGWLESLRAGLFHKDNGRAIRDAVRLLDGGYDPVRLFAEIAAYDARHAEYGTTHALPVAADCARMLSRYEGARAAYAIAPAIDMCSEANQRLPERASPSPLPFSPETESTDDRGASIREAIEAEDLERAEGLLLGAFASGVDRATVEGWLFGILSDHFTSFGHQLIYLTKAQELLDRLPAGQAEEFARRLYPALLVGIGYGTREDTLPYMAGYTKRLRKVEGQLPATWDRLKRGGGGTRSTGGHITTAVADGSLEEAFDAVWSAIQDGVSATRIAEELVVAAAQRLFRFDVALDADPAVAENWLWATHRFTFASAVRNATLRHDSPDTLRFLFQALAFIHSGHRMDVAPDARTSLLELELTPEDVVAAIAERDVVAAVGGALHLARRGTDAELATLAAGIEDLCLADPLVRPIVVAHAIKTSVAAFEEAAWLRGRAEAEWPLVALVRFLASPIVERRIHEAVRNSILWVAEGVMPRKLTQ